jgi:alkanesulfonate monooxygenase SsuD/methylene tetrahydromethanopterin reductase-like flavin-dependent oxidoreductase (luciferase family)
MEARWEPKPVPQLRPVWLGGSGEQHTLRVVARHADGRNYFLGLASSGEGDWYTVVRQQD